MNLRMRGAVVVSFAMVCLASFPARAQTTDFGFDGSSWSLASSVGSTRLEAGWASGPRDHVVGGSVGALLRSEGSTWNPMVFDPTLQGNGFVRVSDVAFASPSQGWATGASIAIYQAVPGEYRWREDNAPTTNALYVASPSKVWAVGCSGSIWGRGRWRGSRSHRWFVCAPTPLASDDRRRSPSNLVFA